MEKVIRAIKRTGRLGRLKKKISIQQSRKDMIRCGGGYEAAYGGFDVADMKMQGERKIIYSFGIGEDLSFSEDALKRWDCDIFAFDPAPRSIAYVKSSGLIQNERFHFFETGLSDKDETGQFHLPVNDACVSGSLERYSGVRRSAVRVSLKRLSSIMKELGHSYIDVLKMDIEGTEFRVFSQMETDEMKFHQLCVEVHDRFFIDGEKRLHKMIAKLAGCGYRIVSISENYEEFTFLRE